MFLWEVRIKSDLAAEPQILRSDFIQTWQEQSYGHIALLLSLAELLRHKIRYENEEQLSHVILFSFFYSTHSYIHSLAERIIRSNRNNLCHTLSEEKKYGKYRQ